MLFTLALVLGCTKDPSVVPAEPEAARVARASAEGVTPEGSAPEGASAGQTTDTPASLYAACRDRVELPEADGECVTDADCAAAGCSGETCTTVAAGAELMSTCDQRDCFGVLEACGCVDGRCAWSLKDHVPVGLRSPPARPLPPGVPPIPTGPQ